MFGSAARPERHREVGLQAGARIDITSELRRRMIVKKTPVTFVERLFAAYSVTFTCSHSLGL